jgi:predicted Zn-dependent peptidase
MSKIIYPDRTKMPQPAGFEKLNIADPEKIVLNNGLPAYIIPGENQEITRLDLIFDAGTSFQDTKLQAAAVNNLLSEGTQSHTSVQIAEILDFHGAYTDYFLTKDTAGITLYGLTKYYDRLLPLIGELITEAVFPEKELQIYVDRKQQEYLINIQKVRYKASQAFNKLIFGEKSAYGQVPEAGDFGKFTRENLLDFYHRRYRDFYIILSGKINDSLLRNLNRILGAIPWKKQQETVTQATDFVLPESQQRQFIKKKKALQSALRLGTLSLSRRHPDYPGLNLLNTVLGGYFGSRLMSSIREEKGYTYGIFSTIQNHRHASLFAVATEVNAKYTAEALQEIKHQMRRLCKERISETELNTVKNYVYGTYLSNFDGPVQLAERFKKSAELEIPFSFYKESLEQMMQHTPDDLLALAGKYLNPDNMKTLVVGNISTFSG